MSRSDPTVDQRRRTLLLRLGLAGGTAWMAPALGALGVARADDDDDDDDDAGDAASARDREGPADGDRSRPRKARRPQRIRRSPPPPPEMVALLPPGTDIAPVAGAGYRVLASAPGPRTGSVLYRLALPAGRDTPTARQELRALLPGALADTNHLYRPDDLLCDATGCAAHAMIGWSGWPSALAPRIGMIDTGINVRHEALREQKITVHQIPLDGRDPARLQHGTAVAALLVGRLDSRVPGLLPMAELVAVEAFHVGEGGDAADAFSLARAVETLIGAGVGVINMSFSGPDNEVLHAVVQEAALAGIGLVAAAGNGGPGAEPAYPAAWPEVVAVSAVDRGLRPYRQGNRGPYIALAAPGVNLWTAASVSGGRLRTGTSYAAPFVAATLAVERLRRPEAPVEEVVRHMLGCARDLGEAGFDEVFGHGLVAAPGQCHAGDAAVSRFLTSGD